MKGVASKLLVLSLALPCAVIFGGCMQTAVDGVRAVNITPEGAVNIMDQIKLGKHGEPMEDPGYHPASAKAPKPTDNCPTPMPDVKPAGKTPDSRKIADAQKVADAKKAADAKKIADAKKAADDHHHSGTLGSVLP